jgi:hypothetical protein
MKTFAKLFEERRGAVDNGAYVRSKAAEVFSGTSLVLREGMPSAPPNDGARLGIAFYSLPDLLILDDVVERSRKSSHARNVQVEIIDILTFKSMQDVETLFPGLTPACGTPMIGVWEHGELIQKGWGVREAQRISRTLFM